MARSLWQGLLDWWKPVIATSSKLDETGVERGDTPPARSARHLIDVSAPAPAADAEDVTNGSVTDASDDSDETAAVADLARVIQMSPEVASEIDAADEELLEFLAADYAPVEADPEFKRKLREQLWTLLQRDELTRQ